jgi:hypothetical protein
MIKDRLLKLRLLKYYLLNFWYPELEVNIKSKERISPTQKLITDIDALALYPDVTGNLRLYLGDCKTLKNQSPIARVLWMKGLLHYLSADKGIILLTKEIEKEHQLSAYHLNVQLFSDKDFEVYSKSTANYLLDIKCALENEEKWDEFFSIPKRFPALSSLYDYGRTQFWNEDNSRQQLRSSIQQLRVSKKELNPDNTLHLALTLNHFALTSIALNNIIIHIFNKYLLPATKDDLDKELKVFIYGGIENYELLNDLRKRITAPTGESELGLPDWNQFLELIRTTLEKPLAFNLVPLLLKELAFIFLLPTSDIYNYSSHIIKKNTYTKTYAIRFIEYMCRAGGLPPEFKEIYLDKIHSIS